MAKGKPSRRASTTARDYPRTARLNELLRQILADELERVDDERLELLTVVSVDVDADLRNAMVYYDNLEGEDGDAESIEALVEARPQLKRAIGRQAHVKRVPELAFAPDPAIREGMRIEALLRSVVPTEVTGEPVAGSADEPGDGSAVDPTTDEAAPRELPGP